MGWPAAPETRGSIGAVDRTLWRLYLVHHGLVLGGALAAGGAVSEALAACGGGSTGTGSASVIPKEVQTATGTIDVLTLPFYQVPALNSGRVKANYTSVVHASDQIAKVRSANVLNATWDNYKASVG
jgi:hypothetical protein